MDKVKVLIADDSVIYRSQIRAALQGVARVEVVGAASNGRLALERLSQSKVDLLILDLEMPEMSGIETLKEINRLGLKCKVLVFSAVSKRGAEITLDALRLGASDFITKPSSENPQSEQSAPTDPSQRIRDLLVPKLEALFSDLASQSSGAPATVKPGGKYPTITWDLMKPKIIVIGSSTGGPTVLERIFADLSGPLHCPIVIAQHMPPVFTATLAERLSRLSGIPAREASHGTVLEPNHIYVAPGDFHARLKGTPQQTTILLDQGPQINSVRPAVDPLFETAAEIYKDRCLGMVLTGMGADGREGAEHIKRQGGAVVIQNAESCVVFGMPGAVFAVGAYDRIATPSEIVAILKDKAG